MADITHTLGLDETEFVRGLKRAEDQTKGMDRGIRSSTASVKAAQEGFQRLQGLILGTGGAITAVVVGVAKIAQGIEQFRNGGDMLDRELSVYKQVEVSLSAQLTQHQQITRAIQERYQESLRQLDAPSDSVEGFLSKWATKGWDAVLGGDTEQVARDRIESNRRNAETAAAAAEKNRQELAAEGLARGLRRDVAAGAAAQGEDPQAARFRVESLEHEERLSRIRELTTLDKARVEELTKLEQERHWRVVQSLSVETAERITKAAREREEQARTAEQRRMADEESIARTMEDLRISNLRAEGKAKEAEQAEITARYESVRQNIERSSASEAAKRDALAKLGEQRTAALALAGRPEELRTGMRSVGTGLGEQATRQALGGGPGRAIERTTTGIAVDLRKAVEILNKMSSAAPIARLA